MGSVAVTSTGIVELELAVMAPISSVGEGATFSE